MVNVQRLKAELVRCCTTRDGRENDVVPVSSFKDMLRKNGFYKQWQSIYGEQAWALLEQASGKLT